MLQDPNPQVQPNFLTKKKNSTQLNATCHTFKGNLLYRTPIQRVPHQLLGTTFSASMYGPGPILNCLQSVGPMVVDMYSFLLVITYKIRGINLVAYYTKYTQNKSGWCGFEIIRLISPGPCHRPGTLTALERLGYLKETPHSTTSSPYIQLIIYRYR